VLGVLHRDFSDQVPHRVPRAVPADRDAVHLVRGDRAKAGIGRAGAGEAASRSRFSRLCRVYLSCRGGPVLCRPAISAPLDGAVLAADRRGGPRPQMNREGRAGAVLSWPPASGKFRLLAILLLGLCAVYGLVFLAVSVGRGWPDGFGDSFALWSWGRFVAGHDAAQIYDAAALRAVQLQLGIDPGASYP